MKNRNNDRCSTNIDHEDKTREDHKLAKHIRRALGRVNDPELHMDIITLGLVYKISSNGGQVNLQMTLTTPGCPYGPDLLRAAEHTARSVNGVKEVSVDLVWDPPWGPELMSDEAKLQFGFDL